MARVSNKKNYWLTLFSGFGGHSLAIVLNLLSVPISLDYWGKEKYGLFAIINSVIVYLSISSLGLNSAASVLMAKNAHFSEKITILKRSFAMLLGSVTFFSIAFYFLNFFSSRWIYLLGDIPEALFSETYYAMLLMVVFFFINAVFSHIDAVFNGFQKLYVQKLFDALFLVLSFAVLLLTIAVKGNLCHFVLFNGLVRLFISIAKIYFFYTRIYADEKIRAMSEPSPATLTPAENEETSFKVIVFTGLRMVVVGIAAMIVWNTDNLVISHYLGIDSVTPYSVSFRIYSVFFSLIAILNGAIMPLIAREMSVGNWMWINRSFGILLKLMALAGGLFWLSGILFLKDFIIYWAGIDGFAGLAVIFALGGYSYLLSIVNLNAGVAIAFNYVDEVMWVGWIEAIVNLVASIMLLKYFGLAGVATGKFLGSLFGPTIFLPLVIKRRSKNKIEFDVKFILTHLLVILIPALVIAVLIQLLVTGIFLKVVFSILLLLSYAFASRKILPDEVVVFIKRMIPSRFKAKKG